MAFTKPHVTIIIAIFLIALALLFQIIGVADPNWIDLSGSQLGLWEVCAGGTCAKIDDVAASLLPDWLKAMRVLGVLGILAMAASCVSGVLICFLDKALSKLSTIAPLTGALGVVFSLVEWVLFAAENYKNITDTWTFGILPDVLGPAFILTVLASIFSLLATVLFHLGRRHVAERQEEEDMTRIV